MIVEPFESNQQLESCLADCQQRVDDLRGIFDYTGKKQALLGLRRHEDPTIWDDPKRSADLQKQIKSLDNVVTMLDALSAKLDDLSELWQLAKEDDDASMQASVSESLRACVQEVEQADFCRMFSKPHDANDAFVEINPDPEAQRHKTGLKCCFACTFGGLKSEDSKVEVLDYSAGEVAGIKGATIKLSGDYAYGWARTETGIHRLVRKSPFDSGNRRHTSFAAVFVTAEIRRFGPFY